MYPLFNIIESRMSSLTYYSVRAVRLLFHLFPRYGTCSIKGFFDGVKVNSWRCLPEGAIMFFTFDALKHLIGISQYDTR